MSAGQPDEGSIDLGVLASTETPFMDVPYGLVTHFSYAKADVFWLYVSEHTDILAIEAMWAHLPKDIRYQGSEKCPRAYEFRDIALDTTVHYFISTREGLPVANLTPEIFFSTQVAC